MSGFVPQATASRPKNYDQKIIHDIIPAVETRYNTYRKFATPEGIAASRDHRTISGYSRGTVMT